MARRRRNFGSRRAHARKFVWDRTVGSVIATAGTGPFGVDLLEGFRNEPGGTHLGATIMRVRGYIKPIGAGGADPVLGVAGLRVDTWNEDETDPTNQPTTQPDADWMAWLPFDFPAFEGSQGLATWNLYASPFAVDVKSNRKLEELNETLWLFLTAPGAGTITYDYNLSVGLKLD